MTTSIYIPGIGNSDAGHWQSLWQAADPAGVRIQPHSWDAPDLQDWLATLEKAVVACPKPPHLIAHSLGCLLVAHWARTTRQSVKGAFLVAVPDPQAAVFPKQAHEFVAVPRNPLPFSALVVSSENDPYGSLRYAKMRAAEWRAAVVEVGRLGHISTADGLGSWSQGQAIFERFKAGQA